MELMFTLMALLPLAGLFGKLGTKFSLKINLCKAQLKSCAMLVRSCNLVLTIRGGHAGADCGWGLHYVAGSVNQQDQEAR